MECIYASRLYKKDINNQVNAKTKLRAIDLYSNGYTQQPVNLPNNPVLNNNSTQQELQDYNRNQIHNPNNNSQLLR